MKKLEIVVKTDEVLKLLGRLRLNIENIPKSIKLGEVIAETLRRNVTVKTGRLRRSITVRGLNILMTPHWKYTEYGVKPYTILPKKAKVLVFKVGKKTVFTRKVEHPGFKGQKWVAKSLGEARQRLVEVLKQLVIKG
ncbi:MAG: hypothetical protein ACKD6N_03530 [Candidatus Bathyarchaeota archaeon]